MIRKTGRKYSLWWYYALSVAIVLAALLLVTGYVADRFSDLFIDQQAKALEAHAGRIIRDIEKDGIPASGIAALCDISAYADKSLRVTLIDAEGVVLCDSDADVTTMEDHSDRPEVRQAISGVTGTSMRYSNTLESMLLYVALPHVGNDGTWVVRTAKSLAAIDVLLDDVFRRMIIVTSLLVVAIFLVSLYLYRKINPPLHEIRLGAERFARGDFERTLPEYEVREISELADAMNRMVTKLDRLENLRREFVANVSHELKTPVTSIKGFTETLIGGAKESPRELDRFLDIILRQTDRLSAIIDDLLTLSRLESAPLSEVLALDRHDLCEILNMSLEVCRARADKKSIDLWLECAGPVYVTVDQSLLLQAVVNLIDNAIKYSPGNTGVGVRALMQAKHIRIDVSDEGPGIMDVHIPRLFERFYRADKARSRELGGTGLGLAIVKHIVNVHQGEVAVASNVGAGSTFSILLPLPA